MLNKLLSAAAFTLVTPALLATAQATHTKPMVVGYVFPQNNILQPGQIDAHSMTRINYAFANIENGLIVTGFSHDAENYAYLVALRKQNPDLTVLTSVGGWLWSTNFSDVCLTPASRKTFIDSVMTFLARYDLDGLDIDWEYPGMIGAGHPFRAEDKQNFTSLVRELRVRFDLQTRHTHRHLYLTMAAGSSNEFIEHTEMDKVQKYLDTVNLMAYDYYEPDSDKLTGHHAPLYTSDADPKKVSADASVQAFKRAGVPADKMTLGLPFYGHVWGNVEDHNHGLFQPGKPTPKGYAPFNLLAQSELNSNQDQFVRYWDPSASVPYLYSASKQIFISYEDAESIAAKCRYVQSHKLAGVMFWEYASDPTGTLLSAINASFRERPSGAAKSK